ncbi:MAG TPA: hypothetical protein DHU33_02230 [Firmicutes bacterium]|nr:hypothetical protein [Bacillota bacterium]
MNTLLILIANILLSGLLIEVFFNHNNAKNQETKLYSKMLIINFISSVIAIFTIIIFKSLNLNFLTIILKKLELVLNLLILSLFLQYNLVLINKKVKTTKILKIIYLINIILVIILPMDVSVVNNTLKVSQIGYTIYHIISTILISIISLLTIKLIKINKKNLKKSLPFLGLTILSLFSILLQIKFPESNIYNYFISYILLIMYFTIENPDTKVIEQLNIEAKKASEVRKAQENFLASMSHEVRTPLNTIVGLSTSLEENPKCPVEMKQDLQDIVTSSYNLLEMFNNVIDINEIETGTLKLQNEKYNIKESINEVINNHKIKLNKKNLTLNIEYQDNIPKYLYGDIKHLKVIITNILSNAIKYTKDGKIDLLVRSINEPNKCNLIIIIKDTGIGMKEETLSKMYHKFERLDTIKNSNIEGMGLGLALTKRLVELMHGTINFTTTYQVGTTFTIMLPQEIYYQDIITLPKLKDLTKSKRVLIVDDNPLNIKVAKRALEALNYTNLDTCDSGFKCLEKIKNGSSYDIILMDIMMPGMSGTQTLENLKNISSFRTPVVALTADALMGANQKYLSQGFSDYLAKPYTKEQLKNILNKY